MQPRRVLSRACGQRTVSRWRVRWRRWPRAMLGLSGSTRTTAAAALQAKASCPRNPGPARCNPGLFFSVPSKWHPLPGATAAHGVQRCPLADRLHVSSHDVRIPCSMRTSTVTARSQSRWTASPGVPETRRCSGRARWGGASFLNQQLSAAAGPMHPMRLVISAVRAAYDQRAILNANPILGWLGRMGEPRMGAQHPTAIRWSRLPGAVQGR